MIKLVCGVVNSVGVEHVHFTVAVSLGGSPVADYLTVCRPFFAQCIQYNSSSGYKFCVALLERLGFLCPAIVGRWHR